jgi:hypothetical protein
MSRVGAGTPGCDAVRLEISAAILTRLLAQGHLRAADLRCLDCDSMHCLRRSCLQSCVWRETGCKGGAAHCPFRDEDASGGRTS